MNNDQHQVPFSLPTYEKTELDYIQEALQSPHRHGSGKFNVLASQKLKEMTQANKVLLTHSCTGALELAMLLLDIGKNDEVILPSFTFSSTANAIVLRGAVPVFADIDPKTQCIDPHCAAQLITEKTRAILPVHYAGVGCDMEALSHLAQSNQLALVEDAAQTIGAARNNQSLGTFGELGAFSFHDSKNISSGEGGALLINHEKFNARAEILWEKGTNRSQFMRGEVDKYTWVDVGSSFLPSEVTAAFLLGQLERVEKITRIRCQIWNDYYDSFAEAENLGICTRPFVPLNCRHNGHLFYLMMRNQQERNDFLNHLHENKISATFHYVALHSSPAGKKYGRMPYPLPNTERAGNCLVRLPLFPDMTKEQQQRVIQVANEFLLNKVFKYRIVEAI
jgi:dTDP-4-amino-4,6-dideoxygalactose transaminase